MSSSSAFSLDHLSPSEQLCYVHCNFCDTVLAVSVPCSSLFKTVTVRCGHCTNLLSVNMRGLLLPAANQLQLGHAFFSPSHNLLEEIPSPQPNLLIDQPNLIDPAVSVLGGVNELPRPPVVNRRETLHFLFFDYMQDLIPETSPLLRRNDRESHPRTIDSLRTRSNASRPEIPIITHREAFSAAAKNWAHFPHIHFGLLPDQTVKKTNVRQQEGEDVLMKDGFSLLQMLVTPPTKKWQCLC